MTDDDWRETISNLGQLVRATTLTQLEIARATGVSQSQISRILAGQPRRLSRNVLRLCMYARTLQTRKRDALPVRGKEKLDRAIDSVWNGSAEHAEAIAAALASIARVQRVFSEGK